MTTWMESLPGWHRAYAGRKSIGDVREVGGGWYAWQRPGGGPCGFERTLAGAKLALERARLRYVRP